MDVELLIYIIIGIVYILSRVLKKPEQVPGEAPPPQRPVRRPSVEAQDRPASAPRPMSFEELLREITEAKQPRAPEPEPEPVYEAYEEIPDQEARSLETTEAPKLGEGERIRHEYQEVPIGSERKSLEETLRLEDTVVEFGRFEQFERKEERSRAAEYRKLLSNPESLRQAVVLSEILNRKF